MLERSFVEIEKCWRRRALRCVVEKSAAEKCCREVETSVGEGLEKRVEKCWRQVL